MPVEGKVACPFRLPQNNARIRKPIVSFRCRGDTFLSIKWSTEAPSLIPSPLQNRFTLESRTSTIIRSCILPNPALENGA